MGTIMRTQIHKMYHTIKSERLFTDVTIKKNKVIDDVTVFPGCFHKDLFDVVGGD